MNENARFAPLEERSVGAHAWRIAGVEPTVPILPGSKAGPGAAIVIARLEQLQ
jgi:hypothetical protein